MCVRQKECPEQEIGDISKMKQTKSENTSSKITQRLDSGRKLENYQDLDKSKEVFFLFPGYN